MRNAFRPPAVPLVACDPYFSIWSAADHLNRAGTTHWTGKPHRLALLIRVDGVTLRLMGLQPAVTGALEQQSLAVTPTRTLYEFAGAGVAVTVTFLTPALPDDLDVLARPVTYLISNVRSTDGKPHEVQLYFHACAELVVNFPDEVVAGETQQVGSLSVVKIGSVAQPVLAKSGDDIRIDWGYLYVAAEAAQTSARAFATHNVMLGAFMEAGARSFEARAAAENASRRNGGEFAAGMVFDLGSVTSAAVERCVILAYDDLYSIQYLGRNLRPYWRRNGWEAADLLQAAARELPSLRSRCEAFDEELTADLTKVGGPKYAQLAALAFRQCFAAGKFVADDNGQPLSFCKENHSNGCISTSDVFYPMSPLFLLLGPTFAKSFLVPFMNYASSARWKFPFAPHDLGTYPHANGQVYGGGEKNEEDQMPVEESANLLLLMAAVAQMEGNADFAGLYWPRLEQWANYLKEKGLDPELQLCTDDFTGHLAHNVNLSAKAICALGAFGKLCALRGERAKAKEYRALARQFAEEWARKADDGDHFRLAFDRPGTWSQKYNLVWDRILGLGLFPQSVRRAEMAHYRKIQNAYGLPLDNRSPLTKLDWILWTATLTGNKRDFKALVEPVHRFLNETPWRLPMTDRYWTHDLYIVVRGCIARPVIGAVFIPLLYNRKLWAKYAGRDNVHASGWAAAPAQTGTS